MHIFKSSPIAGVIFLIIVNISISCRKEKSQVSLEPPVTIPVVSTTSITANTDGIVAAAGMINSNGGLAITERGICWSTTPAPTISNSKTSAVFATDNFMTYPTALLENTIYYFRAYAINSKGTGYGNEVAYKTGKDVISISSISMGEFKSTIGLLHGIRISYSGNGLPSITKTGICWSTKSSPNLSDSVRIAQRLENPLVIHTSLLTANTKYFMRGFAIAKTDTVFSNEVIFQTPMNVGYLHAGGIILTVNETKTAGTVVSRFTIAKGLTWAPENMNQIITGANSQTDGAGNTDKIIASYGNSGSYAARSCRDYRGGGFSDWYLPSKQELEILRARYRDLSIGKDVFSSPLFDYWSSTELNGSVALKQDFEIPPKDLPEQMKFVKSNVIAVRAF